MDREVADMMLTISVPYYVARALRSAAYFKKKRNAKRKASTGFIPEPGHYDMNDTAIVALDAGIAAINKAERAAGIATNAQS